MNFGLKIMNIPTNSVRNVCRRHRRRRRHHAFKDSRLVACSGLNTITQ